MVNIILSLGNKSVSVIDDSVSEHTTWPVLAGLFFDLLNAQGYIVPNGEDIKENIKQWTETLNEEWSE